MIAHVGQVGDDEYADLITGRAGQVRSQEIHLPITQLSHLVQDGVVNRCRKRTPRGTSWKEVLMVRRLGKNRLHPTLINRSLRMGRPILRNLIVVDVLISGCTVMRISG